jgi:hypothetical protein
LPDVLRHLALRQALPVLDGALVLRRLPSFPGAVGGNVLEVGEQISLKSRPHEDLRVAFKALNKPVSPYCDEVLAKTIDGVDYEGNPPLDEVSALALSGPFASRSN